jgi:hypothetical protein
MFNAGNEFDYKFSSTSQHDDEDQLDEYSVERKSYRRSQPSRPNRRRNRKATTSHPGYGIAGRRNRRWSW